MIAQPYYINAQGDTITPIIMSQGFLDSCKNAWLTLNQHTTQLNAANFSIQNINGQIVVTNNTLTGVSNQTASNQINVAKAQADVDKNGKRVDSIVGNWPSGGGGASSSYKFRNITSNMYTISVADSGQVLFFTYAGNLNVTVTVPQLSKPINVKLVSQTKFITVVPASGMNLYSPTDYRRVQSKGTAELNYNSSNSANLVGQITK